MTLTTRFILSLLVTFVLAGGAFAQEATPTTTETTAAGTETAETSTATTGTSEETSTAPEEMTVASAGAYAVREQFTNILSKHPADLATILALDPSLMSNDTFMAPYPDLREFIAKHPQVRHTPRFYLREFSSYTSSRTVVGELMESLTVFATFMLIAFALAWAIRTINEQKRWNRLSRTQSEVHNKILDRFGTSAEVLDYIKTPAGTKFLESAPIQVHDERPLRQVSNPPFTRAIWSIQIGVVLAVAALGMLLVSGRFDKESAQGFFALGAIGFSVGAGFIASAVVSIFLSRRLGLWQGPGPEHIDHPGIMR